MLDDRSEPVGSPHLEGNSQPLAAQQAAAAGLAVPGSHDEPAKRLIEVIGRKLVIALAIGSVVGATLLCLFGVFFPTWIPSLTSRFFLCLLTAFLFSVFVFTLYPSDYRLDVGKLTSITFVLVGPAALWIALFLVFWYMLPHEDTAGKVFAPAAGSEQLFYSTTWILKWRSDKPVHYQLKLASDQNSEDPYSLAGFYVVFDTSHDQYSAEVGVGAEIDEIDKRYLVSFSRGDSTYKLQPLEGR